VGCLGSLSRILGRHEGTCQRRTVVPNRSHEKVARANCDSGRGSRDTARAFPHSTDFSIDKHAHTQDRGPTRLPPYMLLRGSEPSWTLLRIQCL